LISGASWEEKTLGRAGEVSKYMRQEFDFENEGAKENEA
jgi:hypothetical protein